MICPYGGIKVGVVVGKDTCHKNCAAFESTDPGTERQWFTCRAGKFTIGFIEVNKDV
jgi:hypothetical protein